MRWLKTWKYLVCDMLLQHGSWSFNETGNSTMCWCPLHLRNKYRDDLSFMCRVTTCDKTWTYHRDPKTKWECAALRTLWLPVQKKVHQAKSVDKVELIIFFFFLTNMESFIDMWSHPLVKDKNEPSITDIIVRFVYSVKIRPKLK